MNMNFDLLLKQTQKLIMTQQLQMAIKILQLPSMELDQYIQNQLEDNPVLEAESSQKNHDEPQIDWKEFVHRYDNDEYYENENSQYDDDDNVSPFNFIANVTTLKDHLLTQLHLSVKDAADIKIGEYLIENIDTAGYLRIDIKDAAKFLKTDEKNIEHVLKMIQTFDPSGVGARNIQECLIIQLKEQGMLTDLIKTVIEKYLNEIGEHKYNIIARDLGMTLKDAQAIGDIIKSLEPKPGRGFADSQDIKYIVPDVEIEKISGKYVVIVNERTTPRLSINPYYRNILKTDEKDDEARKYVRKKLDSAAWLIKSIEQRKATIYNVVNSIVKLQQDFFDKGLDYLKPLTLKDVANVVGVHESTVSRAINGKYVQTPRGLFPIKFFFTRGIDVSSGNDVSSESIKKAIKDMLSSEDALKPLSDQKITDKLNKNGINISRRTVAKYREEIGIQPASKRKRF